MTLSLRDDIATFTDQKKGFEDKNKLVVPEDFETKYDNSFSSPSSDAEMDSVRKARAAEKEAITNYKLFTEEYKSIEFFSKSLSACIFSALQFVLSNTVSPQ